MSAEMNEAPRGTNCACGRAAAKSSRQCRDCHSAYMREWRKAHPLNAEQRMKMNARSYANVTQRRGRLKKEPCQKCGSLDAQKHHADYSKPLEVEWLCRDCHGKLHKAEADAVRPLLTRRETEIVLLICDGLSEKEIAGRLGVAPATVSTFKGKAYKKIGVHKDTALVRWAIRTGRVQA